MFFMLRYYDKSKGHIYRMLGMENFKNIVLIFLALQYVHVWWYFEEVDYRSNGVTLISS